jgi:hypothetical protein
VVPRKRGLAAWKARDQARPFPCGVEPKHPFARLIFRVLEGAMSERRITQLFGLILGAIFTFGLVLNAFAF